MIFKIIIFVLIMFVIAIIANYLIFHVVIYFFSRDFFGINKHYYDDEDERLR